MLFINKLFNSIACLLSFTNLQLVIPGRTWILLYLGRTVYKRLWACLALYKLSETSDQNSRAHTFLYYKPLYQTDNLLLKPDIFSEYCNQKSCKNQISPDLWNQV